MALKQQHKLHHNNILTDATFIEILDIATIFDLYLAKYLDQTQQANLSKKALPTQNLRVDSAAVELVPEVQIFRCFPCVKVY